MPNKAKLLRRKHYPNVGLVAKLTTQRNGVGKEPARTSNLSAPDLRIRPITIPIQKLQNPAKPNIVPVPVFIQKRRIKKLASPRLQYDHLVSVRQYIRSDPPTQAFHNYNSN